MLKRRSFGRPIKRSRLCSNPTAECANISTHNGSSKVAFPPNACGSYIDRMGYARNTLEAKNGSDPRQIYLDHWTYSENYPCFVGDHPRISLGGALDKSPREVILVHLVQGFVLKHWHGYLDDFAKKNIQVSMLLWLCWESGTLWLWYASYWNLRTSAFNSRFASARIVSTQCATQYMVLFQP